MRHIVPMLLEAMQSDIVATMQTDIPADEPTRADIVKIGRWQDDPKRNNVYVAISGGDPEDVNYRDGILTLESMHNIGFTMPAREVGGGQAWWRRGIIQVGCYWIRERFEETVAVERAYEVLGRLSSIIESIRVGNLEDDFGEHAVKLFLYGNTFFESGGPPKSYIFRGKLLWACLTERP